MKATIRDTEPSKIYLEGNIDGLLLTKLRIALSYTDQKLLFAAKKFKQSGYWYLKQNGKEEFDRRIKEMQEEAKKVMLFKAPGSSSLWTYSGNKQIVEKILKIKVQNEVKYPEPLLFPWKEKPEHKMRPYQEQIVDSLLEAKHACIQVGTGLGKSFSIMHLIKRLGLKTILMSPATNITEQLYQEAIRYFGKANVGAFFDGKKESKKMIVIGNAQSFTKVVEGTPHYKNLRKTQVFAVDESHQVAASTLASVCFDVAALAPYRFFFSATQIRGDGLGPLLEAITGPSVFDMTLKDGVDQGYLAKPVFRVCKARSGAFLETSDVNEMSRKHLYYNPEVAQKVAQIVNECHEAKLPTLVLIEEVEQFTKLLPYLRVRPSFAHGPLNEENKPKVPSEFWDSDTSELVKKFNDGLISTLIGTSCISTGTDIRPVKVLVYWQGGKSEVQVKQAIGRGTRLVPGKTKCTVIDFDVYNVEAMHRHALARRSIYEELYGPVEELEL